MILHNAQRLRWVIFLHLLLICLLITDAAMSSGYGRDVEMLRLACTGISQSEIDRIMRLEFASSASVGNVPSRATSLRISCVRNEIVLSVKDTESGELSTRRILLPDDTLVGKERVIALAAVELISSSWEQIAESQKAESEKIVSVNTDQQLSEGSVEPLSQSDEASASPKQTQLITNRSDTRTEKKKPPSTTPRTTKKTSPAQERKQDTERKPERESNGLSLRAVGFQISPTGQLYPSGRLWLFGGELAGVFVWNDAFEVQLSGGAAGGRAKRSSGTASLFSTGGALLLGFRGAAFSSRLTGAALLGFRLGYGRLAGRPKSNSTEGHELSGLLGGPLVRLSLALSSTPRIGLSAELGYAAPGIEGNVEGESDVNMSEWWGMISINLRFIKRLNDNFTSE